MKKYKINQSPFYKCKQKRKLADILGIEVTELKKMAENIEYYKFINKKGRTVYSPNYSLKRIQSRTNKLLGKIEIPNWLQGGIKKRSNITNSKLHKNSHYFLVMDIKIFFENCQREYMYSLFKNKFLMEPDCAEIMTNICTYDGKLVTGSPASVLVSFFAYEDMFNEISSLLNPNQILSVYVDDITISSAYPMVNPENLKRQINNVLKKYRHSLNLKKSHYLGKAKFKKITGVVVTPQNRLTLPNKHMKLIIDGMRKIEKENDAKEISKLSGRLAYIDRIDENKFLHIKRKNEKIKQISQANPKKKR